MPRLLRGATPGTIARALHSVLPHVSLEQLRAHRFWIADAGEPFAECDVAADGQRINVRFSPGCGSQWSAMVVSAFYQAGAQLVAVYADNFIVTQDGEVRYGRECDAYYKMILFTHQQPSMKLGRRDVYTG